MGNLLRNQTFRIASIAFLVSVAASSAFSFDEGGLELILIGGGWLFVVGIGTFVALVSIIIAGFQRKWSTFGRRLGTLVFTLPLIFTGLQSGIYVHLLIMLPWYLQTVDDKGPHRFYWGDFGSAFTTDIQFLIYDRTGETLAATTRSPDFRNSNYDHVYTRHLIGSFYLEDETD